MAMDPETERTPGDNTTVTAVLAAFEAAGYGPTLFANDDGKVRCTVCGAETAPERVTVEALRRFEGASDPDEEQVVVAASCPACRTRGAMVLAYGPGASAGEAEVFAHMAGLDGPGTPVGPLNEGTPAFGGR